MCVHVPGAVGVELALSSRPRSIMGAPWMHIVHVLYVPFSPIRKKEQRTKPKTQNGAVGRGATHPHLTHAHILVSARYQQAKRQAWPLRLAQNSPVSLMDGDHEQSLVAWANTFTDSFPAGAAPAASLADFASGDALAGIARTIVGNDGDDADGTTTPTTVGWAGVFSHMQLAGLIEEDAQVPAEEDDEGEKLAMAVTCLEELLRYTVGEDCVGRETFIRQIMSLDAGAQTSLRHIIVGDQPQHQQQDQQDQSEANCSESGSPCRDNGDDDSDSSSNSSRRSSFLRGLPGHLSPAASGGGRRHRHRTSSSPSESSYGENDSVDDDLGVKSWYSPHPRGSARRQSNRTAGGRTGDRAAPVGPKPPRHGRTLDMDMGTDMDMDEDGAEQGRILKRESTAASAATAMAGAGAASDVTAGWTATAVEVSKRKSM